MWGKEVSDWGQWVARWHGGMPEPWPDPQPRPVPRQGRGAVGGRRGAPPQQGPASTPARSPATDDAGSAGGRCSPASLPCASFGPAEHPTITRLACAGAEPTPRAGGGGRRGRRGAFIKWAARSCQWSECAPWLSCGARRCWSSSGPPPPAGTCPQRWCRTGRVRGPWAACPAPSAGGC